MIRNIRDLGGLSAFEGRKIKKNLLIRSAMLHNVDEKDIAWMRDVNITKIFDLRTHVEVSHKPDVQIEGIENVNFCLQDESKGGLTMKGLRALMISAQSEEERLALIPDMKVLYASMVNNDYSRNRFAELIRDIINYDKGAILFHCTSGKDRTGMTAAMLCAILGVNREDIFDDYLQSLEHAEWESSIMRDEFIDEGASEFIADKLKQFFMLDRAYLETFFEEMERLYGTVDNFIKVGCGIDDAMITNFRNRVLE